MNPFAASGKEEDPFLGTTAHTWREVRPDATWAGVPGVGAGVSGSPSFTSSFGPREFVNFAESYALLRIKLTDDAGNDVLVGDQIAMSRFSPGFMWQKIDTWFGGRTVESVDQIDLIHAPHRYLTKSSSWLETSGTKEMSEASYDDREARAVVAGYVHEMEYHPPTGLWNNSKLVRPGKAFRAVLYPQANWWKRIVESDTADKTHGAGNDFLITVESISLFFSVYMPRDDTPLPPVDVLSLRSSFLYQQETTAATAANFTFSAGGIDAYAAVVYQLEPTAGTDITKPLHKFFANGTTDIRLDYASEQYPKQPYGDLDFATGKVGRAYADYLSVSSTDGQTSGAALKFESYRTLAPFFAFKLPRRPGARGDHIIIRITKAAAASLLQLIVFHSNYVIMNYDAAGELQNFERINTEKELREKAITLEAAAAAKRGATGV